MEFQDKMLKCIDCGADFVFTAGEQLFFRDKQFKNEPKRCKACKSKRVAVLGSAPPKAIPTPGSRPERFVHSAAKKLPYPSGRHRADQFFAASASSSGNRQLQPN